MSFTVRLNHQYFLILKMFDATKSCSSDQYNIVKPFAHKHWAYIIAICTSGIKYNL